MARTFQIRRGAKANLPTLAQGEFAMTTDSGAECLWLGTGSQNKKIPLNPTAADVGAMKTYKDISELGLTTGNVTMSGIFAKMAVGSQLLTFSAAGWPSGVVPAATGTLFVQKIHAARITAAFTDTFGRVYTGTATGSNTFGGWSAVYHTGNKPTAADLGAAQVATGQYVGTGQAGEANMMEITVGFVPRYAFITKVTHRDDPYGANEADGEFAILLPRNPSAPVKSGVYVSGQSVAAQLSTCRRDNSVRWCHDTSAAAMMNAEGWYYYYMIVGDTEVTGT